MKYGLMVVSTPSCINIGDYIQALAARQFLPEFSDYIEREKLKDYKGNEIKMIMNGYYMHDSKQWPPSPLIHPLLVAVHINSSVKKCMLDKESISYFKQYEPIGCRDKETERLLKGRGVNAYFSGCLTLTLGRTYKSIETKEGIYFVDPTVTIANKLDIIKQLFRSFIAYKDIYIIYGKYNIQRNILYKWAIVTKFYFAYKKLFSKETLINATYISQQSSDYNKFKTNEELLNEAERLLKLYSKAKYVVTSRIHCALPCLGMDTSVLYTYDDFQPEVSYCRMDGLIQLFNVLYWDGCNIKSEKLGSCKNNEISEENFPKNKQNWRMYANTLVDRCEKFTK